MILKPSTAILSPSCISFPLLTTSLSGACHLPPCTQSHSPSHWRYRRGYATTQKANRQWSDFNLDHTVLPPWPQTKHPTPYEILGIQKGAAYSKHSFYQLVKLYHPDTHDYRSSPSAHSSQNIPHATRLERYRLIIAANELLSNSTKRRLYDTQGVGWNQGHRPSLRDLDRSWRHQRGSAANNATWEDWERWHESRDGTRYREPLYMSHGTFASIVVVLCMIGALAQANRAESAGGIYVEWSASRNAAIGEQLRVSGMTATGRSKDERVDSFLRDRENVAYQFVPSQYDAPQRDKPS